ncbi:MAG: D-alanine--D-alanine ligase [Clostridia bacterium]|nr:D-alanine--D-alanine ligase [Clostridia bacterium]
MKKVAVIYGGKSTEHEISIKSAQFVLKNIDRTKYDVVEIYIDSNGDWDVDQLKGVDVAFPVLHGLYGEDGTIQGTLEMMEIPYVGCHVLASAVCMDKVYAKLIFDHCGIRNAKSVYVQYIEDNNYAYYNERMEVKNIDDEELNFLVSGKLKFPVFVKPSNSGSSIGVERVEELEDVVKAVKDAAKFDKKVLIEEGIIGKEVEVAVCGNARIGVEVSRVGEIMSAETFYSYAAKYENAASRTVVPADLTEEQTEEIRRIAEKAYIAVDGDGLSRCDFFVQAGSGKVFMNEINTLPGLTNISMWPILMRDLGYEDSKIIDKLIEMVE